VRWTFFRMIISSKKNLTKLKNKKNQRARTAVIGFLKLFLTHQIKNHLVLKRKVLGFKHLMNVRLAYKIVKSVLER
jgi:hypothetical protein